jgi:hypothetical protein
VVVVVVVGGGAWGGIGVVEVCRCQQKFIFLLCCGAVPLERPKVK